MMHFYLLPVKKIQKETDDCISITFNVPEELKETFRFVQGQNLTIRKQLNGQEIRRNYSICSGVYDNELRVAVKKVDGGLFSTYALENLQAGDILEVMPPSGKFYTPLLPQQQKTYVAFAAGSGITPVLSIIKTTLQTEPRSSFTLVYGNRSKNSIIFKEELEALKDKYMDRFIIHHILSKEKTDAPINSGRIDIAKCEVLFDKLIDIYQTDEFFLCGPEGLIFCVKSFLEEKGISQNHIHFELFTVPGEKKPTAGSSHFTEKETAAKSKVSVKMDGILFDFDLAYNTDSILDAALAQGADLPYACKGGVCTTCKARLLEGKVTMDVNWGLEPDELEKGFILTCQSHPETPKVVVDFDSK
jgi:ring-1,2-phenylacetyl-CoA epoxidase subunit PaaE